MGLFSKPEVVILKETSDAKEYLHKLEEMQVQAKGAVKEQILKEMAIIKAGIAGEDNLLFELKNSGMDMVVLHDICIKNGESSAQIDFFVVTPKMNFIIECKNLFGNIEINSRGDFIRTFEYNGKKYKEGIYSPITQNERHMNVLKAKRLEEKGFLMSAALKMTFDDFNKSLVVLANPKTVINDRYAAKGVKNKVIRADQLIATIKRMNSESKEMKYSPKEMLKIGEKILSFHVEERTDYTEKYKKPVEETNCPKCGGKLVERKGKYGVFIGCSNYPKCKYTQSNS